MTGGICVWLVVREHLWNWPIGIANNIVFFFLFLHGRLFADMSLQIVYLGLGVYGWLNWLFGGEKRDGAQDQQNHTGRMAGDGSIDSARHLGIPGDSADGEWGGPFWDSLTTVLSLAAQYLLCRKRFENWFLWIAADVIYVPLYLSRHLPLTAVLYAVFLGMCLIGVREWNRSMRKGNATP